MVDQILEGSKPSYKVSTGYKKLDKKVPEEKTKDKQISHEGSEEHSSLIPHEVCRLVSGLVKSVTKAFSPLVSFLSIDSDKSEHRTVTDLNAVIDRLAKDENLSKGLSQDSKIAFGELSQVIDELYNDETLRDMDICDVIKEWRDNPNSKILLEIVQKIESGQCVKFDDEELKEKLVDALRSFARALKDIENKKKQGHSSHSLDRACKIVVDGASAIVDDVDIIQQSGGDSNLTNDQQKQIISNLKFAADQGQILVRDPAFNDIFSYETEILMIEWMFEAYEYIEDYYNKSLEEENEELSKCQQRDGEKRKFLSAKLEYKKKLSEYYLKNAEKNKKLNEMFALIASIKESFLRQPKIQEANNIISSKTSEANNCYSDVESLKNTKCKLLNQMLPSSVCDHELLSLELDVMC